jgi:hypothetical protein
MLIEYVGNGGRLMATYETSLYNIDGSQRRDFALADIFGCHYTGEKVNTRKDFYQYISDPKHPVVQPDNTQTELLINAGHTLLCRPTDQARKICTYVPVVHNQPPEKAWTNEWSREFPTVVENTYKEGIVIYFANQPDLVAHEFGHPDMRNLLLRSIKYLAGTSMIVETNAPESVHIGLTRSTRAPAEYIFSMVNTTSAPVRPLRTVLPVHDLDVKLNLGRALGKFKILKSAGDASVTFADGRIELHVTKLEDFFAVHLTTV